jgi:hypothetical protein
MPENMVVRVMELGKRPSLWTKARMFAPQGAKVFAELFEQQNFAEAAMIIIDWTNELKLQPVEAAKPVLIMRIANHYQDLEETLTVESRIDIDDVFGGEAIDRSLMVDLVNEMKIKVGQSYDRRKHEKAGQKWRK